MEDTQMKKPKIDAEEIREGLKQLVQEVVRKEMRGAAKPRRRTTKFDWPEKHDDPRWEEIKQLCSHCGRTKPVVGPDSFGIRVVPQGLRPQNYCNRCRSQASKEYYQRRMKAIRGG